MRHYLMYRWLTAGILSIALLVTWTRLITEAPIEKDAVQTLRMAVNLERHGIMSLDEAPPYTPSNYREPVPAIVSAGAVWFLDATLGKVDSEAYFSGPRLKYLKYQNIFWLGLLSIGVFLAMRLFSASFYLNLLAVVLINISFCRDSGIIDNLYTDLPAAAVATLASVALTIAATRQSPRFALLAGLLFGILVLIKAAVLYVFIGVVAVLGGFYLFRPAVIPLLTWVRELIVLIVAFGVVVGPWMYRNHVYFGTFQISQRAGVVLMMRAVKDQMTLEEYRGSFYVWAHPKLQHLVGNLLGFNARDLQRGGRLQHLNTNPDSDFANDDLAAELAGRPDETITYYRRARAERVKLEQEYYAAGHPQPEADADTVLKQRAMALILAHPLRHIALIVPFMWRGAFFAFPTLVIVLAWAARQRRADLAIFALPSLGIVMFYALFSHFIGRYSVPVSPVITVLDVLVFKQLWDIAQRNRRPGALA
jgi:hypothetical protein